MRTQKPVAVLLGISAIIGGLVIAVGVLVGLVSWTFAASSHDINVPRAIGALALTQQHASYWESEAARKQVLEEMLDGLAESTEIDTRWQTYFVAEIDSAPGERPDQFNAADEEAIQQLRREDGQHHEFFSADGRHYVRAVSYSKKCLVCHASINANGDVADGTAATADTSDQKVIGYLVVRRD